MFVEDKAIGEPSIEDFKDWLATKNPESTYHWNSPFKCVAGQYFRDRGFDQVATLRHNTPHSNVYWEISRRAGWLGGGYHTYGKLQHHFGVNYEQDRSRRTDVRPNAFSYLRLLLRSLSWRYRRSSETRSLLYARLVRGE